MGPQEPLLATVKRGNMHALGMLHATTVSPKPSGHLGGWTLLWSAKEMFDEQHQRVDIPAHARTAHMGLLQKRLAEDLCWVILKVPLMTQSGKGLN